MRLWEEGDIPGATFHSYLLHGKYSKKLHLVERSNL